MATHVFHSLIGIALSCQVLTVGQIVRTSKMTPLVFFRLWLVMIYVNTYALQTEDRF